MLRNFAALTLVCGPLAAQVPIAEIEPSMYDDQGWILHDLGDVDGDGVRDVGSAYATRVARDGGYWCELSAHSGADRRRLSQQWWVARERSEKVFVQSDGSGEAAVLLRATPDDYELAIGAPGAGEHGRNCGVVEIFTGLDNGAAKLRIKGSEGADEFGAALARVPDLDGLPGLDLAIGAPTYTGPDDAGHVHALGTVTLRALLAPPEDR